MLASARSAPAVPPLPRPGSGVEPPASRHAAHARRLAMLVAAPTLRGLVARAFARSASAALLPQQRRISLRRCCATELPAPRAALARLLATLVAAMLAAGCASQNARFYTELPQPGTLSAGSPVVNLGTPIGTVASVSRLADGNAGVAFDVDRNDAAAIRRASIMVVRDDPANPGGASLDLMNADPLSPPASPGTQIDGASNQAAANSLVAAKNLAASAPAMAMMMSAPGGNAAVANTLGNTSPAWLALQQQILALQTQMLLAGTSGAALAAQQLAQINQNAAALEQQLIAAGNSPAADQLRRQIAALSNSLTAPLGAIPPTVGSASPYGAPAPSAAAPPYGSTAPPYGAPSYGTPPPSASAPPYGGPSYGSPPPYGTSPYGTTPDGSPSPSGASPYGGSPDGAPSPSAMGPAPGAPPASGSSGGTLILPPSS